MMLSIAPAVADGSYYLNSENYYDSDALGTPQWVGKAAAALGLTGSFDSRTYDQMCQGELPNGTMLGKIAYGERQHAPGWDLTFSAPKSISIMALVGGDRRLIEVVNQAAREAVTWMEENATYSRFTEDGKTISRPTGNLALAMFTHDLTRAQDPQLHVHAVGMNVTQGPDGEWRSLDSRHFYWLAKEGGFRFQQVLALLVRKLGYEIEVDSTKGTFEIAGIPRAMIESFSTRSKQIIGNLAAKGLDRETATTLERKAAAVETRAPKEQTIDRATLAKVWRSASAEFGVDLSAIKKETSVQVDGKGHQQGSSGDSSEDVIKAVRTAAQILGEKEIAFSDKALVNAGERQALGRADAEQWTATVGTLSSPDRITGLQGFAGTAKTSTVLATVSGAARGVGHQVSAMAPTTDAALKLGHAIGAESKTVARHLGEVSRVRPANADKAPVWIVDEASMVSAKTMKDLIRAAEQHDARLVLVFDVLQLGSVGAGRAAGQLIEHGMTTHYLDRIVRQSENLRMTDAVKDLIRRDPGRALWQMEAAGSKLLEAGSEGEAHAAMAKEYISRSPELRDKSIVIDPTRDGVAAVSDAIREQLIGKGELTGDPLTATVLEDASLTERERATSTSYQKGQIVRLLQPATIDRQAVARGSYLEVEEVAGAMVILRGDNDKRLHWEPRANSLHVQVFDRREKELQVGDQIRWSANNDTIKAVSGRLATVVAVDHDKQRIDVEHKKGGRHQLDLMQREHQHFGYGYAVTAQRAQGADAFPIINAPSWRVNTIHLTFAYIAASRTSGSVFMVTDGLDRLTEALETRSGQQIAGLDQEKDTAGLAEAKVREMAVERVAAQQMAKAANEMETAKERYRDLGGAVLER